MSTWSSTPNAKRHKKNRKLTLSDEAWAALGALAGEGGSRSAVVERLAKANAKHVNCYCVLCQQGAY